MGVKHITPAHIERLRKNIPAVERAKVMKDLALAPAWMRPLMRQVAQGDSEP